MVGVLLNLRTHHDLYAGTAEEDEDEDLTFMSIAPSGEQGLVDVRGRDPRSKAQAQPKPRPALSQTKLQFSGGGFIPRQDTNAAPTPKPGGVSPKKKPWAQSATPPRRSSPVAGPSGKNPPPPGGLGEFVDLCSPDSSPVVVRSELRRSPRHAKQDPGLISFLVDALACSPDEAALYLRDADGDVELAASMALSTMEAEEKAKVEAKTGPLHEAKLGPSTKPKQQPSIADFFADDGPDKVEELDMDNGLQGYLVAACARNTTATSAVASLRRKPNWDKTAVELKLSSIVHATRKSADAKARQLNAFARQCLDSAPHRTSDAPSPHNAAPLG